ncbi:De-etiolated protein 1 Det1-domain-containing protein [Chlamydoabsidia padenii]|nr:De-etiolated protein 1 Det1-domain-containing protein [Chlamydoabsidia padenii]
MNLYNEIKQRQLGNRGKGQRTALKASRLAYSELVPNHIIYMVQVPQENIIIRFTLDGKYLLCLANSTNTVHLYYTKTCLYPVGLTNDQACFPHYFGLKYKQPVNTLPGHTLCKSFCLLLDNRKYMILASSKVINPLYAYPVTLGNVNGYSDYAFYSIDIETGQTIGQYTLSSDYLFLNQNACVSLYGQMLTILSLKNQEIILLLVDIHGKFHEIQSIGKYMRPGDQLTIDQHEQQIINDKQRQRSAYQSFLPSHTLPSSSSLRLPTPYCYQYLHGDINLGRIPMKRVLDEDDSDDEISDDEVEIREQESPLYRSFQQAFLSYLYRTLRHGAGLQQFYRNYQVYANMKIWRVQFLDERTLLIKLSPASTFFTIMNEPTISNHLIIFVVLKLDTYQIDQVFDQSSEKVIQVCRDYGNTLRGHPAQGMTWFGSNWNNLEMANFSMVKRNLETIRPETIKRLSLGLPVLAQSYMDCPYFDLSLFRFSVDLISLNNRHQTTDVIKFYSSITNELKFTIDPNPSKEYLSLHRRPSKMIPHPTAPFIITTQYPITDPPVINFHVYKPSTN